MRLDLYLFENGLTDSRTEAKKLILAGAVSVDGRVVTKSSYDVVGNAVTVDNTENRFVSRGGYKLLAALTEFHIDAKGALALDVGASSGGFTDCLLQSGAKSVIAVDAGSGQLAESLRRDERVTVIENYNARYMRPYDFEYTPTLAVMDVSFISATYIIPSVYECLAPGGSFICLIKPQFEVGRSGIGKGGIVKDERLRNMAVDKVVSFAKSIGFENKAVIVSPITGGDGNVEFLACFVKPDRST